MKYKKNIMYVYSYPSVYTGSPRVLIDMVSNLDRNLFQPHFLTPRKGDLPDAMKRMGVPVSIIKWVALSKTNPHLFLYDIIKFISFFRQNSIDLLHINEIGWRYSFVIAAKILKIPILLHLHVTFKDTIKTNLNLQCADKIIVVSNYLKKAFKFHPSIYSKLFCIHNGVDLNVFTKMEGIRDSLGIAKNEFAIGFVGQISEAKGLRYLIEAAPEILKSFPNTVFLIVGKKVLKEDTLTEKLIGLAESLGVRNSFQFLGTRDNIQLFMNSIDLLVLPTHAEAFAKVIIEAMACHTCVIASDVGGIPEIIQDGKNGLLVTPKNVNALKNAILMLMENEKMRIQLAETGYKTAVEEFSMDQHVKKVQGLYTQLLAQKRTG